MKSYHITYLNPDHEFETIIHWAINDEEWFEVAKPTKYGAVMRVLEEVSYSRWSGMKCKTLFDKMPDGKKVGEFVCLL